MGITIRRKSINFGPNRKKNIAARRHFVNFTDVLYTRTLVERVSSVSIVFIRWLLDHIGLFIPFLHINMAFGCDFCLLLVSAGKLSLSIPQRPHVLQFL